MTDAPPLNSRLAAQDLGLSLPVVLKALLDALSDSPVVVDGAGRYVAGAPRFDGEPVPGADIRDFPGGPQADDLLEVVRRVLRTGRTEQVEYKTERGGTTHWFIAALAPVSHDRVIWLARDVSDAKRNEDELRRWKERHLALVNSVDVILWETDAELSKGFTFVSDQAVRLLGYPLERWLNEPNFWAEHMHPDDGAWCLDFRRTKTTAGEDHDFEYRMIAADGRTVWLRDIVTVVLEDGRPTALRGVMIDITPLKGTFTRLSEQESQYRNIFESTSDGLVVNDLETGAILAANPAFCRMHGYDDMVGMHPTAHIHPESHHLFEQYLEAVRAGGELRARAQDVRSDGTILDVEVLGRAFVFDGKPAVLGVVRDVTEQVRGEQLLEHRVAERTRELESLLSLARGIASTLDLDQLVRLILDELRQVVEYSAASLILVEGDDLVVHDVVEAAGRTTGQRAGIRFRRPSSMNSWHATSTEGSSLDYPCVQVAASPEFWAQLQRGSNVIVSDVLTATEPLAVDYRFNVGEMLHTPALASVRSWMAVPLMLQDEVSGYIGVASHQAGYFTEKHALLARAFADHASVAIQNARLYEQAQRVAVVDERQRLARDLHDSVAQALYGIALGAKTARRYLPEDPRSAVDPIDYVVSLAAAGLAEMRALIFDLHPESIEREGLVNALQRQVSVLEARHGVSVSWTPCPEPDVPLEVKEAVYAIVREAVHNVVKHAQATTVRIEVQLEADVLRFEIEDDGVGFDARTTSVGHLGLHSMRERAEKLGGRLIVSSNPGDRGTLVTGVVPASPGAIPDEDSH